MKKVDKIAGWFHVGYLRIVFHTAIDAERWAAQWRQSASSLYVRLVIREYSDEYLMIDKPYYESIERLTSQQHANKVLVRGVPGYMLETQVEKNYYVYLASRGGKAAMPTGVGNWCHLSYGIDTYDSSADAIEAIAEQEQLDRELLPTGVSDMVRYVVRTCYGEVRDVVHIYREYSNRVATTVLD